MLVRLKLPPAVLLLFYGIQDVVTSQSIFVSYRGDNVHGCGNWTTPCRTVRHAVKISNDGDQIYIDYAQGVPYFECENMAQSRWSIELNKSLSFHGFNGRAELMCGKAYKFFAITSANFKRRRIRFSTLAISQSDVVVELEEGARMELEFHNTLFTDNNCAIFGQFSRDCSVLISNSSFEKNGNWGIYLRCPNLKLQMDSRNFEHTPAVLINPWSTSTKKRTKTEILVQNTIFDGKGSKECISLLAIQPFVDTLNVTITDSGFKNFFAICNEITWQSGFYILDWQSTHRRMTIVFLSNLLVENVHATSPAVYLMIGYSSYTEVYATIKNSIFRNNTMALKVKIIKFSKTGNLHRQTKPTITQLNNTFVNNIYDPLRPDGAAAIYINHGRHRVLSCRFLDNGGPQNFHTGVVIISEKTTVSFSGSYFENRQTKLLSNQLFVSTNTLVSFAGENTFNLVALKEKQSVFTRIPAATGHSNGIAIKNDFRILCPQGYKLNVLRQCEDIPSGIWCNYINVQCEQCPTKTYVFERGEFIFNKSNDLACQGCPPGGDCVTGLVTAKPNFWGYKSKKKIIFVQCPPGYCCDAQDCISYDSCHGNRVGTLCGQCREGMSDSLFSTKCISNKHCSLNYFFILGTIAMLVFYLGFFLYHKEISYILRTTLFSKQSLFSIASSHNNNISSSSGMTKIFFYYYQICNLLRSSLGFPQKNQFIQDFEKVISKIMNMVLVNLPSFSCPFTNLRPLFKIIILHSVGYVLLAFLCLIYLSSILFLMLRRLVKTNNDGTVLTQVSSTRFQAPNASLCSFSRRAASAFTHISLLMYASSTQMCLSLLHCVPVKDNHVLFLDGNVKCYQAFQYVLLAYIISSVIPFCLVPVFGSYLLKSRRIGVKQFYAACIVPLPFCCFWLYLLLKDRRYGDSEVIRPEQDNGETQYASSEEITMASSESNENIRGRTETAVLGVLLSPFKTHKDFKCFPSSHIPWEGFLIFRRLILITVLTFIYDIQLRLIVASTVCVGILMIHMFVNPFQRKIDNVVESFSLGAHVVLSCLTLKKALYYGRETSYSSFTSFTVLNAIESILFYAPLSVLVIVVIFVLIRKAGRLLMTIF